MKTVTLGNTGIKVSELGFGAMYLPRASVEESDKMIARAIDLGINYFDTASAYSDSEEKLGRILSKRDRDFIITSRSISYKMGLDAFKKDFDQSMSRLGLDMIDFYGFHAVNQPDELKKVMEGPLDFLKEQKEKGKIKHIAITGHNVVTMIDALKTGEFEMSMFPFNVIETEPLDGLLETVNRLGVATSVMKPMAGGVIDSKALALRFFFNYESGVITPGMSSMEELEQNFDIFEKRELLSTEELKNLEDEVSVLGKEFCRRCSYCMPCPNGIMIPFVHMIHMKCFEKEMDDSVAYTLKLGQQMKPALEKCDECGKCFEKCPYNLSTPKRVKELLELLNSTAS